MREPLTLLVIEDEEADFRLIERQLRRQGVSASCHRVTNLDDLKATLGRGGWDAVISDYSVPKLEFSEILAALRAHDPDLPLILVSGSVGEERAVELLKLGVWDFVLKGNLTRLAPALERNLRDAVDRRGRQAAEANLRDSRLAALNMMEDAVEARKEAERVSAELRREVAEREEAQRALSESEARLRMALQAANQGIYDLNVQTGECTVSPEYALMLGHDPTTFRETNAAWLERLHPEDRELVGGAYRAYLAGELAEYRVEFRSRTTSGDWKWILSLGRLVAWDRDGKPLRMLGTHTDISQRKRLEQERWAIEAQLRHQQKLESIGTLAGGVAHEINNPINGIMNYAQLIQDRLPSESPLAEYTGEILHETQRVATIVQNLLTFARDEKQSHSPARLTDIVEGTLSLIRTVIRHDQILLQADVPADLPRLRCRSQQIQQVLMNLMTNARDALNERYPGYDADKVLRISAGVVERDGRRCIRVTVEDHGTGITPEVRERMFDPFFTTKPRDRGTGLGLSISHGIVKDHDGEMTVETQPGGFTRMHVDLPADNA